MAIRVDEFDDEMQQRQDQKRLPRIEPERGDLRVYWTSLRNEAQLDYSALDASSEDEEVAAVRLQKASLSIPCPTLGPRGVRKADRVGEMKARRMSAATL